ncbi:ADP-ribosylation factor-binding protein GGA3-like isoform X1 [Takifugu flavidus]|uniref:ADP-ribosylation factor-binding protein GGA3-like isoform X1 n=2 Tax=Takifugu flavidus TaxID=433684 RepID=UPI0025445609|nr:ADP-ribosylation factor-binding protein GGA3-like isoform X1 [Takifugu flavidus]
MAAADGQQTLESLLCQITDPANQEDRWDCIQSFYQLVNQETDGPQAAIHLLSHKIQSPQEKEALQALTLLEACMNNCGKRFHGEVAKFRFLNELIKVLSPKYFGAWTSQTVKDRVTEVLYGWTLWLKDEPKIKEAYSMLKRQGIVEKDPKLPDTIIMAPPPQRTTQSVFDQEDKATLLARLLKSNRPEDLETANRLIKSTLKEEQEKAEKASKRESTLKEVESNTKALRGLLDQHKISGTLLDLSDDVKTVYERCDRMRPTLFRLASDTMDDDLALNQILEANDELTLVVNAFKEQVGRNAGRERSGSEEETEAKTNAPTSTREIKSYRLIDFSGLDSPETLRKADSPTPVFPPLMENDLDFNELDFENGLTRPSEGTPKSYYEELIQLNADFQVKSSEQNGGLVLRSRGCGEHCPTSNGTSDRSLPQNHQFTGFEAPSMLQKDLGQVSGSPRRSEHKPCPSGELKNIFVPLESIKSSHLEPVTLLDRGGIRVSLHFTVCPRSHPDVAVLVVSTVNTSALPVKDYLFQAAVPKTMSVKLQPASGTQLTAYNPLLPPPAISQVLLLANPQERSVRLRYRLTLTHGDQQLNETGEIESLPDWMALVGH